MTTTASNALKVPTPSTKPLSSGNAVNFASAAQSLMFGGQLLKGLQYREGKSRKDVAEALTWATSPSVGFGRTEVELDMLARRLKKVFQPTLAVTATPSPEDEREKLSEIRSRQSVVIAEVRATGAAISAQGLERVSRLLMEQAEQASQARAAGAAGRGA